jgi:acetyltransferase-like isoleucine patch superfamily enzyme
MMRNFLKGVAFWIATGAVLPIVLSYWLKALVLGRDRALQGSTQLLALAPGLAGQYLRRAFLCRVLEFCDRSATVEFGTIFSQVGARLGRNAYVGPHCHLGLVHLEDDVLIGPSVHIPSGPQTHGTADLSKPMRDQSGEPRIVRIGSGAWIGCAAVVMADVGHDSIVAAGAVVTHPIPDRTIAGGVPARVIGARDGGTGS